MGGVGISSTPSPQRSSDLEKTQAELRQTFTAAEKFRRELEFLQKGGDPLDLKPGNAAAISFQSTSLTDRHPEQFVMSEAKGSFAVTASPHGDSVDSSGRLGAPSVCEPNSADNLMLLKESGDSAVLELPKKSYKRRIRSRPNRDPLRHTSRDFKGLTHDSENPERNYVLNSNSKPKSPNAGVALKNSNSFLENELDGVPAVQSNLGPAHGPYSAVLEDKSLQNTQENHREAIIALSKSLGGMEPVNFTDSKGPTNGFEIAEEIKNITDPIKVLDSESSCTQASQRFGDYNGNGVRSTGAVEQNLEGNDLGAERSDKILSIEKTNSNICHPTPNEDAFAIKEKGLKGSDGCTDSKAECKPSIVLRPNSISQDGNCCSSKPQGSSDIPFLHSTDVAEQNTCSQDNVTLATKEHEDSILEEARIIEAKRKRITELSVKTLPLERRLKSHWDFVLEEMSWLANDFAQERLWKLTAAGQISQRVAFASRVRAKQQSSQQKQKQVSHTLAEAVMQFWQLIQVKCKGQESHYLGKNEAGGIWGYAMRFLEYNNSEVQCNTTQAPVTPDSISDLGIMDGSWEDNLTEENLFYTVPPGAIEAYRKAIDSHLLQFERTGSSMQEEVDTSCYDAAVADNAFEEDEGETSAYYLPGGFEGSKPSKTSQKRRKNFKFYGPRLHEAGGDVSFMQSVGNQPSVLSEKRPGSNLNVVIPTKRVRTASRQRIMSPFNAGTSGVPNRTDASSADTNSFQDEQSTLHGGSHIPSNMEEAESAGDYEKQLQFDSMEISNRPKKRKKGKHPGSTFEHRWQIDSSFQKDHSRRRLDTHQFDSNGSSVASQMSNMSNPNKFMKLLVRDRGRKVKALKTPVGQPGSGSPWSLFEDQALVVLVHDMGPNWELISDAINSTLQFKCIFRKAKECKERHRILMDRNSGDGADSAEDSGSSQPYPSTLPGIPEGSARQLFQRLQGPMEEDTLKSHFEKIIMIGQKQHYRRTQNDNQDPKQLQQPHSSHAFALSQVCPNNLNGGPVLTPLQLSEAISSSPDVLPVYQGPHSGGLPAVNHGNVAPMLPGSGSGSASSAPVLSNSVHGSSLPSASGPLNPSVREGRYGIPRTGPLSADDQQRMQQYNQMLSARNAQQSGLGSGAHSVTERGARMLPAGNGMGVMCGMNRNMKMVRPGYQGIASPSMLSSTSTPTSTSVSMHSGPGQGSSMLRPRDAMNMIRPNQKSEQQVSQSGTTQGVPTFGSGTSSSFPNQHSQQTYPPRPISPQQLSNNSHHPHHFQGPPPNHANPAYAMRLAKERQLQQQRLLQQQQQQLSTSNSMMPPHAQESQLPVSSPQNNNGARSSSPPVSISSTTPKHPAAVPPPPLPHGLVRNPQTMKHQRPRQPPQQLQHQQQQQQHQTKLMKGVRGNMMHQTDSSLVNGFSGGQSAADKGHVNLYPGSSAGPGKQSVAVPHSSSSLSLPHQQHKTFSGQVQSKKPFNSSDNNTKNQSNHQQHQPQLNQKLVSQKQATTISHKVLLHRKVNNTSDQSTTSKQAESSPMSLNTTSSQPTTTVQMPPCNDANSETPVVTLAAASNKTETHFNNNSVRVSPPQISSVGTESEHSGPAMNQVMVAHTQTSSKSLPNPDVGVQQRQPPS